MKTNIYTIVTILALLIFTGCQKTPPYPQTLKSWKSYKDVENYMQNNFKFNQNRQYEFAKDLKKYKRKHPNDMYDFTVSELSQTPEETYNKGSGFCGDAETFIKNALNNIDPKYNARTVFINNQYGPPHHWVTAFYINDKLYIMDYGASSHWSDMLGVHGPYNSLDEYANFLKSIDAKGFKFNSLRYRD
jgi:hypothetical protein